MNHDVRPLRDRVGPGETHADRARDRCPVRVDVDQLDVAARNAPCEPRDQAADGSGADDGDAIADLGPRIPQPVDGRLEVGGQHGAARRHRVGHHVHRRSGNDVARLVRVQHKDAAILQFARAALHHPDAGVAIFDRCRKLARLKRRPHTPILADRHTPLKDERLCSTADTAVQRSHHDLARRRRRQRFDSDLSPSWSLDPERLCLLSHTCPILEFSTAGYNSRASEDK